MSIRQRLYADAGQSVGLAMHAAHARFVWNLALEQRRLWHPGRRSPSRFDQQHQLTELRAELAWLREGSSSVQQGALRDLDQAYRNWWSNPARFGRPSWHKAGIHEGFLVRDLHVEQSGPRWGRVLVPKVGWVRFRLTRPIAQVQAASSARVTSDRSGRWHVSFTCPPPALERTATGAVVGLDRGVANTLATSDGAMLHVPSMRAGEQARCAALQKRLARQRKGSNRRESTRRQIARIHARQSDRRHDWVEQVTTELVRQYDLIALENLNIAGMVRRPKPKPAPDNVGAFLPNGARSKAGLNRAIYASAWGALARRLAEKAVRATSPVVVVKVNPRNSSRECTYCGHVAAENRESQAVFTCVACGHVAHADTNAAKVILGRGLATQPQEMRGSDASASPQVSRVNQLEVAA